MADSEFVFTSESVTEGHPDKVADAISDSILDAIIGKDPKCRVACESLVTTGLAMIAGEITTDCWVDMPSIVRQKIHDIGYTDASMGFDYETCSVLTSIDKQSPDIAQGVDAAEQGAGDQGLMFGYACDETEELMPTPIVLAHKLTHRLASVRRAKTLDFLRPDGKSQVSIRYVDNKPVEATAVVVSTQHHERVSHAEVQEGINEEVIKKVVPEHLMTDNTKVFVNPTGRFVMGGPMADCGLTGRKIIVDTYGGWGRHGGGAFSGKDPSKVDRSASYMARYVAANVVAAKLAQRCEVQLAYAIGVAEPVSVRVDTFGTARVSEDAIAKAVRETFQLTPQGIISSLNLLRPIYRKTAAYGHFGRLEADFTWEARDKVQALQDAVG